MLDVVLPITLTLFIFAVTGSAVATLLFLIIALYLSLVGIDLRTIGRFLDEDLRGTTSRAKQHLTLYTSAAKLLVAKFGALLSRVDHLRWQLESDEIRNAKLPDTTWWLRQIPENPGEDREEFLLSRVMHYLVEHFRCTGSAVILPGQQGESRFLSVGTPEGRFEQSLRYFIEPLVARGGISKTQFVDGASSRIPGADLSLFGFRYSLIVPFHRRVQSEPVGYLWVGYPTSRAPSAPEQSILDVLLLRTTTHLRAMDEVARLSKELRDAKKRSDEKDSFIAHMSHDIRSPLQNVKAILTVLRLGREGTELDEMIESAERNCDGLGEIVEDLLSFSQCQAGKLPQSIEPFPINSLVQEVFESFRARASSRGLAFSIRSQFEQCSIKADRRQLRRALTNLIGNAIKYTEGGEVVVSIERRSGKKVAVVVRDTGPGMSQGKLDALFTPFAQYGSSVEGFGLGLTVTKLLTEANGGAIAVNSEEGMGSAFSLEFEAIEPVIHRLKEAPVPRQISRDGGLHVLLLGSDLDTLCSISEPLAEESLHLVTAATVSDAKSLCHFDPPATLIIDAALPESGVRPLIEFARSLTNPPYVVLLLSSIPAKGREATLEPLADRVLVKPLSPTVVKSLARKQQALLKSA